MTIVGWLQAALVFATGTATVDLVTPKRARSKVFARRSSWT